MAAITGFSGQRSTPAVGVDDDVDIALAVEQHFTRAVAGDGAESHGLQHLAQRLWLGGGVLDELNAFQTQGVGAFVNVFAVCAAGAWGVGHGFSRSSKKKYKRV